MKRDKARKKSGWCKLCGKCTSTQIHHIYEGIFRWRSEKYDFVIEVCPECHDKLHRNALCSLELKQKTQKAYEKKHGHDDFVQKMGRSWL